MIQVSQVIVVEGRYDKIKLDTIVDGIIVTTDGFNLFKDTGKQQLLKRLARECGIIVLTDSDDAGFKIRKYISDITQGANVYHAYIPERAGKEKRKQKGGKAGLIGVEGIDAATIGQAIADCVSENAVPQAQGDTAARRITASDLFEDRLTGCAGAAARRALLLTLAGLPTRLSTNAMLDLLSRLHHYEGYKRLVEQLDNQ